MRPQVLEIDSLSRNKEIVHLGSSQGSERMLRKVDAATSLGHPPIPIPLNLGKGKYIG